jgi:hypothetical protein
MKYILLALMVSTAHASFEIGGGLGYGQTYAYEGYSGIDAKETDKSVVIQAYAVGRNSWIGAEIGFLKLPEYHCRSWVPNYPLYKGLPVGTYPTTVSGAQDITAHGRYGRLNLYGPLVLGIEPYGFYGRIRVSTDNHEYATYDGIDHAELRNPKLTRNARIFGFGVNVPLSTHAYFRAEIGKIPHATVEYHTLDRDMTYGLIGLGAKF